MDQTLKKIIVVEWIYLQLLYLDYLIYQTRKILSEISLKNNQ